MICFMYSPELLADYFVRFCDPTKHSCSDKDQSAECFRASNTVVLVGAVRSVFVNSVLTVLLGPVVGAASDVFGRKPFQVRQGIRSVCLYSKQVTANCNAQRSCGAQPSRTELCSSRCPPCSQLCYIEA